jgi:hypothetical protein
MRQLERASKGGGGGEGEYLQPSLVEMSPRGSETLAFANRKLYKAARHSKKYKYYLFICTTSVGATCSLCTLQFIYGEHLHKPCSAKLHNQCGHPMLGTMVGLTMGFLATRVFLNLRRENTRVQEPFLHKQLSFYFLASFLF